MEQPDAVIHQPLRLKIMAVLKGLPHGERLEFVRLRAILDGDGAGAASRRCHHAD